MIKRLNLKEGSLLLDNFQYAITLLSIVERDKLGNLILDVLYFKVYGNKIVYAIDLQNILADNSYFEREQFFLVLRKIMQNEKTFKVIFFSAILYAVLSKIFPQEDWSVKSIFDAGEFVPYTHHDFSPNMFSAEQEKSIEQKINAIAVDFFMGRDRICKQVKISQQMGFVMADGLKFNEYKYSNLKTVYSNNLLSFKQKHGVALEDNAELLNRLGVTSLTSKELKSKHTELASDVLSILSLKNSITTLDSLYNVKQCHRVFPYYHLYGSNGGRISSFSPTAQNYNSIVKSVLLPEENVYEIDMSQSQLRILAALSKDNILMDICNSDKDVHSLTASSILGIEVSDIDKETRNKFKKVNFGILYGMTAYGLKDGLFLDHGIVLTLQECQQLINQFFQTFAGVKTWIDSQTSKALAIGKVVTGFGRTYDISGLPNKERVAVPYIVQELESQINGCLIVFFNQLQDCKVLLVEHDGITVHSKRDDLENIVNYLQEIIIPQKFPVLDGVKLRINLKRR